MWITSLRTRNSKGADLTTSSTRTQGSSSQNGTTSNQAASRSSRRREGLSVGHLPDFHDTTPHCIGPFLLVTYPTWVVPRTDKPSPFLCHERYRLSHFHAVSTLATTRVEV